MLSQLNFVESNISLKEKSYYKMGGITRYFASPKNLSEISQVIAFAKIEKLPIAVLGSGSNCIFSDELFDGVVIALEKLSSWWWETDEILFTECGVSNTEVSEICLKAERDGASWMYRMPGQIGASVRMNARCYNGEMSQIVKEILTIDSNGNLNCYEGKKILLGYKNTLLMHKPEIVVGVRFYFPHTKNAHDISKHMLHCEADRNSKQHFLFPSCGSTFKNNYEYGKPSGRIFDELGLKGEKRGDAEVSQYHGNFIWNKDRAKTKDMLNLSAFMRAQAKEKLSVELNLEVQPIGSFTHTEFESCGMKNLGPHIRYNEKYLTGLFYIPDSFKNLTVPSNFPKNIFSSFFTNYFHEKITTLPDVHVELCQLKSMEYAQKNPTHPFLRWTTFCKNFEEVFKLKPQSKKECEKLWEFSVSELFLAHPEKPEYLECEMTPYGDAIILKLTDVRQISSSSVKTELFLDPAIKSPDDMQVQKFGMEFSFNDLKDYIVENTLRIQCALSLGNYQYFLAPYWTQNFKNKADFHQPTAFWKLIVL